MSNPTAEFDAYAERYGEALDEGIRLSGEDSAYFARRRVEWTEGRLAALGLTPATILDFGCGTGSTAPFLLRLPGAERLVGTDVSSGLLDVARRDHGSDRASFVDPGELPDGSIDLVYTNGVFHHIPVVDRASAVESLWRALRAGGLLAFWENNPWNPGTRLVMRRISFDRDAATLAPPEARRLVAAGGFEVSSTDFLFVFPRALRPLRRFEARLARAPLGAQYLVLARKPATPPAA